jgi:hypothetical protein
LATEALPTLRYDGGLGGGDDDAAAAVPKDTDKARLSDKTGACRLDRAAIDLVVAINDELLEKNYVSVRRVLADLFARHLDFAADGTYGF